MRRDTMFWIIIVLLVISIIINVSEIKVTKYTKAECPPCYNPVWNTGANWINYSDYLKTINNSKSNKTFEMGWGIVMCNNYGCEEEVR